MRVKTKRAFPRRQANGNAHTHNDSVSRRQRLTDEEWRDLWEKDGWLLVAGFAFFCFVLAVV